MTNEVIEWIKDYNETHAGIRLVVSRSSDGSICGIDIKMPVGRFNPSKNSFEIMKSTTWINSNCILDVISDLKEVSRGRIRFYFNEMSKEGVTEEDRVEGLISALKYAVNINKWQF